MENHSSTRSMNVFFKCMGIGFVISSCQVNLSNVPLKGILENLLLTFAYNFIVGIWFGLANMFIIDLYYFLKK